MATGPRPALPARDPQLLPLAFLPALDDPDLRDQEFIVDAIAQTPDADGFDAVTDWARGVTAALGPGRQHLRQLHRRRRPALVRASYPPETYARLIQLKNRYDPTNLFPLNQNIAPTV